MFEYNLCVLLETIILKIEMIFICRVNVCMQRGGGIHIIKSTSKNVTLSRIK